ncbi:MAG: cobalamin B12-binding domain-containing protein [Piscinibacter sp.]|nr:cobalamin B12-binding domain-containing protein [Piscinibacter sp.]
MLDPRRRPVPVAAQDEPAAGDGECRRSLRSVLEQQVIPRLTLAHREGMAPERPSAVPRPQADDIAALAASCAAGDRAGATRLIEALRADGLGPDSVLIDLIAPAARLLGQQWEDDRLSFSDVTLGLVLMHELIHSMGYEFLDGPQHAGGVQRVMLASAPGSQHVLGLSIVSEFFRKAGWQVVLEVSASSAELCRAVRNEWFDLVGLSVGLDAQLPGLPALVGALRSASRNPATPVLLGGPVFTPSAHQAERFGAQAICLDARESVRVANALLRDAR